MAFKFLVLEALELLGGKFALVFILSVNYEFLELAQSCAGRYEVSADNVFLHALKSVNASVDGSVVEHFCGFLERSRRHE